MFLIVNRISPAPELHRVSLLCSILPCGWVAVLAAFSGICSTTQQPIMRVPQTNPYESAQVLCGISWIQGQQPAADVVQPSVPCEHRFREDFCHRACNPLASPRAATPNGAHVTRSFDDMLSFSFAPQASPNTHKHTQTLSLPLS